MGSKLNSVIVEELILHFKSFGKFNKSIWNIVTSNINERFEGIRVYETSEIIHLYYKDIEPGFPDTCNYGVTEDEMVKKFMLLKTLPRTLEAFNDDFPDDYEEEIKELSDNFIQLFYPARGAQLKIICKKPADKIKHIISGLSAVNIRF